MKYLPSSTELKQALTDGFVKISASGKYSLLTLKAFVDCHPNSPQADEVYIGRPSFWQNVFVLDKDTPEDRITYLRSYILNFCEQSGVLLKARQELKRMRLICWCHPKMCHGHYLARVSNMMLYAGVGSRKTPVEIQNLMTCIAAYLEHLGYYCRSGGVKGADTAFETGVSDPSKMLLYLPHNGFNGHYQKQEPVVSQAAKDLAAKHHSYWAGCKEFDQIAHGRNSYQILGLNLNKPVDFVVCWTPDGCESHKTRSKQTGGTGTAISLASEEAKCPVFNLKNPDALARLFLYCGINPLDFDMFCLTQPRLKKVYVDSLP